MKNWFREYLKLFIATIMFFGSIFFWQSFYDVWKIWDTKQTAEYSANLVDSASACIDKLGSNYNRYCLAISHS